MSIRWAGGRLNKGDNMTQRSPQDIIGAEAFTLLLREGYAIVPAEPSVEMVEAGFAKGMKVVPSYTREVITRWAPYAGARYANEPGLVSALRAAIAAGCGSR